MATEYTMPKLGHLLDEGKIVEWRKKIGDEIKTGEILMVVETEKTTVEVESTFNGKIIQILVHDQEAVPVGTPIAVYVEDGETI